MAHKINHEMIEVWEDRIINVVLSNGIDAAAKSFGLSNLDVNRLVSSLMQSHQDILKLNQDTLARLQKRREEQHKLAMSRKGKAIWVVKQPILARCYKCGWQGHLARDCGMNGHNKKDCSDRRLSDIDPPFRLCHYCVYCGIPGSRCYHRAYV